MNLELFAMRWLRWQKRCVIVLEQRSPRQWSCGVPDVLGITGARYLIEIEIKRTLSDFKADSRKAFRQRRNLGIKRELDPKQFYYLVPSTLVEKVRPLVPDWAGLMRGPTECSHSIFVVKAAPTNNQSTRLTVKECCRLVIYINNHALTKAESLQAILGRFKEGYSCWPEPDYEI